jgi:hypothetical protein
MAVCGALCNSNTKFSKTEERSSDSIFWNGKDQKLPLSQCLGPGIIFSRITLQLPEKLNPAMLK